MSSLSINGKVVSLNIEAVIFDKDGTLIDVHHYWSSMIKMRAALIVKKWFPDVDSVKIQDDLIDAMGVDLTSGKIKPNGPVGIKPRFFIVDVAAQIVRLNKKNISNDEIEDIFLQVDQETSDNILPLLKLLPCVMQLLNDLHRCGVTIMLATTDITSRARMAMKALGIEHFFSEIIGGDAVKSTKPSPDLASIVIERCNVDKHKTVVIGDHPVDVQMGISAETCYNIGVLTGLSDVNAFDELDCFVVDNLKSIQVDC
jgi:phosphoglycolate phosphatase